MPKLRAAVDEAADVAKSLWGAFSIVEDLIRHRLQLTQALEVLREVSPQQRDRVLQETQLAYIRHERDVTAHGRSGLVRGWTTFLVEAAQKVQSEIKDAERFSAFTRERSDDDAAWVDAAAASGKRWQSA